VEVDIVTEPLLGHSAVELAAMVRRGEVTSVQLVETFIKQIEKVNPKVRTPPDKPRIPCAPLTSFRCSSCVCVPWCVRRACRGCPQLNAMVATRFEEAREEARRADEITQQTTDKAGAREPPTISLLLSTGAHLLLTVARLFSIVHGASPSAAARRSLLGQGSHGAHRYRKEEEEEKQRNNDSSPIPSLWQECRNARVFSHAGIASPPRMPPSYSASARPAYAFPFFFFLLFL
jgi:hypothetical protein